MMVMLYLSAGMPAFAVARISSQIWSISRSRSGLGPRKTCLTLFSIADREPSGMSIMSSEMP